MSDIELKVGQVWKCPFFCQGDRLRIITGLDDGEVTYTFLGDMVKHTRSVNEFKRQKAGKLIKGYSTPLWKILNGEIQ